ncbi:MAG: prepilin-type N-terminal cleavage/methylation domain-containing protein [Planctomycetes bacterium]|nr:prepilin-type N-terminal cleavage/methylation domain-containing protein [Planctomycetota bacterium]
MRNTRKGFTLIELLIVVVIVGILALAAIPLITSNTRDARRAEGEQLLGSARDALRVEYSKTNTAPASVFAPASMTAANFVGSYFKVNDAYGTAAGSFNVGITAQNVTGTADGTGTMSFYWTSGESTIAWA